MGLPDVVKESSNVMVVDVYERVSCSGLPNIGRPVCYFEAGILSAVLERLVTRNTVKETRCWALGDTKCTFIVVFE